MTLDVRGTASGEVTVWRLGEEVMRIDHAGASTLALGWLPEGCYGVELSTPQGIVRTAVQVTADPRGRLRYGFVADFSPGRDLAGVQDLIRRLHLTGVMFYDWAYRHADLLAGGENYVDALDQPISLQSVRELVSAVTRVGAGALGYAAVYAVGPDEWDRWKHDALLTASGKPYGLGDFLFVLDPSSPDWLESFTGQLEAAAESVGFTGFHLDQYGYPKRAKRADSVTVDVAAAFTTLIQAVRRALPDQQLVFNNVNDFPTWATASSPQDAIYVEPWEPNLTLSSLAAIVTRAKLIGGGKPIVMAAYQHVYDSAAAAPSDLATSFTMATLFSHGATQILAGESDRILVDPYYVRNHTMEASTADLLKRWYDFLVEYDELLQDPEIVDVTGSYAGAYNDDCDVSFDGSAVTGAATPGAVWRRVTSAGDRLVIHLINLVGQDDELWDAPRNTPANPGRGTLRFRRTGTRVPRVRVADPDRGGRLIDVPVELDGDFATAALPEFSVWQLVLIDAVVSS